MHGEENYSEGAETGFPMEDVGIANFKNGFQDLIGVRVNGDVDRNRKAYAKQIPVIMGVHSHEKQSNEKGLEENVEQSDGERWSLLQIALDLKKKKEKREN